eukprot:TRINITY_DN56137_c0_g1_i1.p1 TRINITY_DN56137_c0_g1~~TRINITY_DN56137_c0_g1_i1.p1  ORF type:complete len:408 (+),score=103.60 TRINITY_DN56137_c0_g1_i1:84-1226(+)
MPRSPPLRGASVHALGGCLSPFASKVSDSGSSEEPTVPELSSTGSSSPFAESCSCRRPPQTPSIAWLRSVLLRRVDWSGVIAVRRFCGCRTLDRWFTRWPFLGGELHWVVQLALIAWYLDLVLARQFLLTGAVVCWVSHSLKDLLLLPRPPESLRIPGAAPRGEGDHPGFPSSHSAHAVCHGVVFACGAAPSLNPQWACALAALHTAHIAFSRLYLGLHCAADVAGGAALGVVCAAVCLWPGALAARADAALEAAGWLGVAAAVAVSAAALFRLYPDPRWENTAFHDSAVFFAAWVGALACSPLESAPPPPFSLPCFALCLACLAAARTALSKALKRALRILGRDCSAAWLCAKDCACTAFIGGFCAGVSPHFAHRCLGR